MAKRTASRSGQAGTPGKRPTSRARAKPLGRLDPETEAMLVSLNEIVETLCCPVRAAEELELRCALLAQDLRRDLDMARVFRDRYHGVPTPIAVAPVIDELVAMLTRQAAEVAALAGRFGGLKDHDIAHDHLDPETLDRRQVAIALFGPTTIGAPGDPEVAG